MADRCRDDTDRMRGLAGPYADPGWTTPCVVCGANCIDPAGDLFVMCGDCTVRMSDALDRQQRLSGRRGVGP